MYRRLHLHLMDQKCKKTAPYFYSDVESNGMAIDIQWKQTDMAFSHFLPRNKINAEHADADVLYMN